MGGLTVRMHLSVFAASLAVGETGVTMVVCDSAVVRRYCETPPVGSLGVIGVHRRAYRIH